MTPERYGELTPEQKARWCELEQERRQLDGVLREHGIEPGGGETLAKRAARAARQREEAAYHRGDAEESDRQGWHDRAAGSRAAAVVMEREAARLEQVPGKMVRGAGGEVTITDPHPPAHDSAAHHFLDALEMPTATAAAASAARMRQALEHGNETLAQALDAAETAGARDSLTRMLAHQTAAAHGIVMKLLRDGAELAGRGKNHITVNLPHAQIMMVEGGRMLAAAGRLMASCQSGVATLARIKQGGRQTVTVMRVNVADGGQAVVAGNVAPALPPGGSRGGAEGES